MFTNKIHAGGSKEISAPHSSVILVIRGNYSNSEKHRRVCLQFFSLMQIRPTLVRLVGLNLV